MEQGSLLRFARHDRLLLGFDMIFSFKSNPWSGPVELQACTAGPAADREEQRLSVLSIVEFEARLLILQSARPELFSPCISDVFASLCVRLSCESHESSEMQVVRLNRSAVRLVLTSEVP
jgi:hypothetical protein